MSEPLYVLDSTAFYAGIPYQGSGRYYTTYNVLQEIKNQNIGSSIIHSRVLVTEPSKESIERVRSAAVNTGDIMTLSEADISLIALSLDLSKEGNVVLVSDDFAVRNVAEALGIPLSETNVKMGNWRRIRWKVYCKACGKEYSNTKLEECLICGTKLSKKALDD